MKVTKLEDLLANGYEILPLEKTPLGEILLAEKSYDTPEHGKVFETFWAIKRGENTGPIGRCVRNRLFESQNGILNIVTPAARRREAVEDALRHMKSMRRKN